MSSYNYTIAHVWGIPIRINISLIVFLPILAFLIGTGEQIAAYSTLINGITPATVDPALLDGPGDRWVIGIAAAVGLFASVTFHELGHSWVAMRYDIEVESITLWLLGGLAALSSMPEEWDQEFTIAIAGPISSLVLAGACILSLAILPESALLLVYVVGFLGVINIVLAVFNMLPAFPMDGGRVLRALLARNRSYVSATKTAANVGVAFALIFAFLGIVVAFSPLLVLLALFIYVAATSESRTVLISELLAGLSVADVRSDHQPIPEDAPVSEAFDRLLGERRSDLVVVDEHGTITGVLTAGALRGVPATEYESTTVGSLATMDVPTIDGATSASDGLYEILRGRSNVALVESRGEPIGLVSRTDFNAALDLRRETSAF